MCQNCMSMGETCDFYSYPVSCDMTCPAPFPSCPSGTTEAAPAMAPVCHTFDLTDAATACAAGAQTLACQEYFSAESGTNPACASCLQQFDIDFANETGIYLCAEPFLSSSCNGSTGCATDCISLACAACSDPTCDGTVISGECSSYVTAGNTCIAASSAATALCGQASYPNFGAWLQGVGAHYCE
jgi:hypothetical protein